MVAGKGTQVPVCAHCGVALYDGISVYAAGYEEDALYFCCEDHLDGWLIENGGE